MFFLSYFLSVCLSVCLQRRNESSMQDVNRSKKDESIDQQEGQLVLQSPSRDRANEFLFKRCHKKFKMLLKLKKVAAADFL